MELRPDARSPYRRLLTIASGGMGRVDLAVRREGTFERLYAVKHLHAHVREDAELRAMFLDEARVAGSVRHANVVSVLDVGEDDEGPFLVMEYVDGLPLTKLVTSAGERGERLPLEVALRIGIDLARGLAGAHDARGADGELLDVVHRDVSPHNVLVGFDGVARVTDFGIAKVLGRQSTKTSTGILKGKLGYMAPEQLRFRPPDRRSDLFSLGVVLYELLAGERLYRSQDPEETARRILDEPPPDLGEVREDAPPSLVGLLFELLAKDPAERPADGHAVERALEAVLAEMGIAATTQAVREHVERVFGALQRERREEIRRALAVPAEPSRGAPERGAEPTAQAPIVPTSRGWLALASLGLALTVAWAAWSWSRSIATEPSRTTSSTAASPAPPPLAPTPTAAAESARVAAPPTLPAPSEPSARIPSEPARGRRASRPSTASSRPSAPPAEPPARTGVRTWEWTE
ncbi:MAG: protein kinase [Sandaracinus sp.]